MRSKENSTKDRPKSKKSIKHIFRALLLGGAMMAAAMMGCITPDQIEELMHDMNQQKLVVVIPGDGENGDGKLKNLAERETDELN